MGEGEEGEGEEGEGEEGEGEEEKGRPICMSLLTTAWLAVHNIQQYHGYASWLNFYLLITLWQSSLKID